MRLRKVILIRLLIDMDEVICDFLGELCRRYNQLKGTELHPSQLKQYDLTSFIGEEGKKLFLCSGFFSELKAFPHAIETMKKFYDEGHHITIATDAKGNSVVANDKKNWVKRNISFLPQQNFVISSEKYLLDADLLFDDSPDVLNRFKGIKVIMDRPYNKQVKGYRIFNNDWLQFYSLVKSLV